MAEQWTIEEPRVLDVGGEGERVRALKVGLVGGRVDVVTHDDSPAARIEVSEVKGQPVLVRWDGSTLKSQRLSPPRPTRSWPAHTATSSSWTSTRLAPAPRTT